MHLPQQIVQYMFVSQHKTVCVYKHMYIELEITLFIQKKKKCEKLKAVEKLAHISTKFCFDVGLFVRRGFNYDWPVETMRTTVSILSEQIFV